MKIVLDTNIIVSGLFWKGAPRHILDLARSAKVSLFTSPDLLTELTIVLARKKFNERLTLAQTSVEELALGYASLAKVIRPNKIRAVIKADPDDDKVLACAKTAKANYIVSGDKHLLDLKTYQSIEIVNVNEVIKKF